MADLAGLTNTRLYVPEIVQVERMWQRVREFQSAYKTLRGFGNVCNLSPAPGPDELREHFKKEIDAVVSLLGAKTVPAHSLDASLTGAVAAEFAVHEIRAGFRDGLIGLSSLGFAVKMMIRDCIFVTGDKTDFGPHVVRMAKVHGVRAFWLKDLNDLEQALEAHPETTAAMTAYIRSHEGALIESVRGYEPEIVRQLTAQGKSPGPQRSPMTVRDVVAVPQRPPTEGERCEGDLQLAIDSHFEGLTHATSIFHGRLVVDYDKEGRFVGEPDIQKLKFVSVTE